MSRDIIESVGFCRLGGFSGSHPEIISAFPANIVERYALLDPQEFLCKALPDGTEPWTLHVDTFKDRYILSYTFSLKSQAPGVRDDLGSISVVVPENVVNIEDFKILFKTILESFKGEMHKLSPQLLANMLERIYNGVNQGKNIKIRDTNVDIDVNGIIKKQKLCIRKEQENLCGRLF